MTATDKTTPAAEAAAGTVAPKPRRAFSLSDATIQGSLLVAFLVVILVIFGTQSRVFLTGPNLMTIVSVSSVIGLVSLGQALTLISGGFDLSVSGVVPLGGVMFAILTNSGVPLPLAVLAVVAGGAVVGLVNGLIITRFKINPLITTLGTLSISGGLALTIANGLQIPLDDPADGILAQRSLFGVNNHVWLLLALAVVLFLVLRYTVYGRSIYSVGGNREAARLAGIRVDAVTTSVYVICSGFAAVAGIVLASQLLTGSGTAGTNSNLQSITAVILGGATLAGGVGGVGGTLVGVLILGALSNGMAILHVPSFFQTMTTGVVLLLAVGISQLNVLRRSRR